MKYFFCVLIGFLLSGVCYAQEEVPIALDTVHIDLHDKKSIVRGGKFFSKVCMACHTMIYMRYNKLAKEAGVVYEHMPVNITKWPNDIKPPDLTLEVSRRGADWVYTYLHSFYIDTGRPSGVNNLLVYNTAMPGIIMAFQGQQIKAPKSELGKDPYHSYQWYDLLEQKRPGSMTPDQFDATITDLVNFLAYASEPYKLEQERLGLWVIGFLIILFVLMYKLKHAYWKGVRKTRDE